jgi:ATP phosphoribosyltransferase regulatory subunit
MLQGLAACGVKTVQLDIGHVGVYRALAHEAGLSGELEHQLFGALQAKDSSAVAVLTAGLPAALRDAFAALPQLYGDRSVLVEARARLPQLPAVQAALDPECSTRAGQRRGGYDLAELRELWLPQRGRVAAYTGGRSIAIAQGGLRPSGAGIRPGASGHRFQSGFARTGSCQFGYTINGRFHHGSKKRRRHRHPVGG